ncbi:hypothetical protein ACFTWD_35875 [Streptomyces sp. NPDC056943]|uniref:hypothetical protein n=1 Tax=Streptomyces sp. NPDC056943 TaxID=3345971 RepID=UPI00362549CB
MQHAAQDVPADYGRKPAEQEMRALAAAVFALQVQSHRFQAGIKTEGDPHGLAAPGPLEREGVEGTLQPGR